MKLTAALAFIIPALQAQTAPTAYTITQVNSLMGPAVTMTVHRDGDRAVIDNVHDGSRTRALYNLKAGANQSWDANNPAGGCSSSKFSGEWGDPFDFTLGLMTELNSQKPKQSGEETINGFHTIILEASNAQGGAKVWLEPQLGLIIKAQFSQPNQPPRTLVETTKVTLAKPDASVFALPASCANAPAPPPSAAGDPDFVSAIIPGKQPSGETCNVIIRAVKADTYEPVTGIQVSVNLNVNPENMNGTPPQIKQLTRPFRVDNAPKYFDVRARFPDGGEAAALIYRQCFSARTVLLMILKNPLKPTDGVEWQWAKSGRLSQ